LPSFRSLVVADIPSSLPFSKLLATDWGTTIPAVDLTYNLGSPSKRFLSTYSGEVNTSAINTNPGAARVDVVSGILYDDSADIAINWLLRRAYITGGSYVFDWGNLALH